MISLVLDCLTGSPVRAGSLSFFQGMTVPKEFVKSHPWAKLPPPIPHLVWGAGRKSRRAGLRDKNGEGTEEGGKEVIGEAAPCAVGRNAVLSWELWKGEAELTWKD